MAETAPTEPALPCGHPPTPGSLFLCFACPADPPDRRGRHRPQAEDPALPPLPCGHRKPNHGRGMCQACYHRWRKGTGPAPNVPARGPRPFDPVRPVCRHCNERNVSRPKGLCWPCYYEPGVRELYESTSKFARRGVGNLIGSQPLPEPTDALPGTPEKLAVLEARAALGQQLFHPADATLAGRVAPWAAEAEVEFVVDWEDAA